MAASWKRSGANRADVAGIVGISTARGDNPEATVPPRFARHLAGAAKRRRGDETPWVAVARVDGVEAIRERWGDPAAEEFLRSVASALRASLRESDKLSPVARSEYGIIMDAPSARDAVAGLERLTANVAELAGRDHRWAEGALRVGVTPLEDHDPAAVIARAREALGRTEAGRVAITTSTR